MEVLAEPPHFDGKKWKCACGSILATVEKDERTEFNPTSRPVMPDNIESMNAEDARQAIAESVQTACIIKTNPWALELPLGYYVKDGVWLKPKKVLGFNRGSLHRAGRKNSREFRQEQLETATRKDDFASIVAATYDLHRIETTRKAPSVPQAQASAEQGKPKRFISSELPIRAQCSNSQCKRVWLLARIRRPVTRSLVA